MSILPLARPEIQQLQPYDAAEQIDDTIRLNANESPQISSIGNFRRPLNRYPEVRPQGLQASLACRFACSPDQLLVTRGSSEAIDLLIRTFCRAGLDNILTPSPSFSMYGHYAEVQGAGILEVPTQADADFEIDVDAILGAADSNTKIIFVCSPNNPTGTPLPREELLRLLRARADKSAIVVDEAYIEFGDEESAIALLAKYPNLLVLRTLSKALGFAGARCGAVIGATEIIRLLSAVQAPYALATPVVECVEDALDATQLAAAETAVAEVLEERSRLTAKMRSYEFVEKIWPSQANFFLMRVQDAEQLMSHCAANKVLLRHFGGDLSDCIRVSVGSKADNNALLGALDTFGKS